MDANVKKKIVVDGIEVSVTAEDVDDFEVTEAIADMYDESSDEMAVTSATVRLMRLVFGDDFHRVKRELRARSDGRLTNARMAEFASAVFEAVGAKNS